MRRYDAFVEKFRADFPQEEGYTEEAEKAWEERYAEYRSSDETQSAEKKGEKLQMRRNKFLKKQTKDVLGDDYSKCHGYVWLFWACQEDCVTAY